MDVRLPDGTVIQNVPDGITKAQLAVKLKANGMNVPDEWMGGVKAEKPALAWSDVPGQAASNLLPSAANFYSGVANVITHPLDSAKGMLDIGAGALRNLAPESLRRVIDKADNPEQQQAARNASETASMVGDLYRGRYGGIENIKQTLATDPVGVAADLSTVLAGGSGLVRQAGKISAIAPKAKTVSDALMVASKYTNPLTPIGPALGYSADLAEAGAKRLMRSAVKPTIQQIKNGSAEIAVNTLLDKGINPTTGGVNKIRSMVDDLNQQIGSKISGSNATISKTDVLGALDDTRSRFASQVSPTSDLAAIQGIASDFANHPQFPSPVLRIPVQEAQAMKQGTYGILSKKYGQIGSAETEAQKALARGLKEGVAKAVPEVAGLNAQESRLIQTLDVAERRALMDMNKNPMGLALLANNPMTWAAFMADKSAAFKSIVARMLYQPAQVIKSIPETTQSAKQAASIAARTNQPQEAR